MKSGRLSLGDAVIHYVEQGEGPEIVWLPGGDQRGEDWAAQFNAFADGFRNISFDPRGVGKTTSERAPPWTIPEFANDCAELIRAVCEPPVFVCGLSMGSLMVQELALSYPELVRVAIAMGTTAKKSGFIDEWETAEIEFRRQGGTLPPDMALAHYALLMYPSEVLGNDELWEKCKPFVASAYEERNGEMLAAQWQACLDYNSFDRLPECKVPLHVVAFSQDMQTPPARGKLVADTAPDGHFHLLEGLGHCSMFGHRPDTVNACVRAIIEGYL